MNDKDYKIILDQYWNVIEACIEMQADYLGKAEKPARIAPDSVGKVIEELIKARKRYPIKRVTSWQ
jgi:hypothetical protein